MLLYLVYGAGHPSLRLLRALLSNALHLSYSAECQRVLISPDSSNRPRSVPIAFGASRSILNHQLAWEVTQRKEQGLNRLINFLQNRVVYLFYSVGATDRLIISPTNYLDTPVGVLACLTQVYKQKYQVFQVSLFFLG